MEKPEEGRLVDLRLDLITLDPKLQCRASIDMATVEEYADIIRAGKEREGKPPRVYDDAATQVKWLADGWHWWHASHKAGKRTMRCSVVPGTFRDALRHAVGANASHGRQRTPEDKRRSVLACLEDEELRQLSNRQIAELCGLNSTGIVERLQATLEKQGRYVKPAKRTGKDGRSQVATKTKGEPSPDDLPAELAEPIGTAPAPGAGREVLDAKGRPVPANLLPVFAASRHLQARVRALGHWLTEDMEWKANSPDGAFASIQSIQIAIQNLQAAYSSARPYIVCPACSGTLKEAGLDHAPECKQCRADGKPQGWLPAGKWAALTHDLKSVAEGFKRGDAFEGEPERAAA